MNGKGITHREDKNLKPPVLVGTGSPAMEQQAGDDLNMLSKSELVRMVSQLQAQANDYAGPAARLMFILTVATVPWRYRFTLLERPQPPIYRDYTDFILFMPDIFMLATLLLWGLSLTLRPRQVNPGPRLLLVPLVGLTLVATFSVFESVDPPLSIYHALRLLFLFGFYLYIVNEIHSLDALVLPAGVLILTQASVGIAQVLLQRSINLQSLAEYPLNPAWSGVSVATANGVRFLRAYGLADHPNILGGCLAFAMLILGVKLVASQSGAWRILIVVLFGIGAIGLLLTLSRSAWIAFLAGWLLVLGLFLISHQSHGMKQWAVLSLSTLVLLVPFLIYLAPYMDVRLGIKAPLEQTPAEEQSIGERGLLNQSANQLFIKQPLSGIGLGAFPAALRARYPDYPLNYQPAHFVLLDVAAEIGLFGALFYLSLLIAPWIALFALRRQVKFTPGLIAASALLLAVSMVGLFDYYPWLLVPGRLWTWLAWGFWGSIFLSTTQSAGEYA